MTTKNMTRMALLAIGGSAAMAGSALAGEAKATKPGKMTCEEFLALDDVSKPKLVYWIEGFNHKGKVEDATFDIETSDRLVPVLIEECHKEPKASFWMKVKKEWKKVF